MFTLKSLEKYQVELYNSLVDQYNKVQKEIKLTSIESQIFQKYKSEHSLAGMEIWITSLREREFFNEIYNDLQSVQSEVDLKNYINDIQKSIKINFREEDYRFYLLENSELSKKDLNIILKKIISNLDKNLNTINPFYIIKNKSFSFKTDGSPSKNGLDVKLLKTKVPIRIENRISEAEDQLKFSWEYGYNLYKILTKKIISISSPGLVSYSFFSEPGISYLNLKDRDLFDTIDDLVHENSHHHLNLLLKKFNLLKENKYYFYSPWRQELRSSYAILHSVFTFSYGALLFENLIKNPTPFLVENSQRATFRLLEETIMIKYSLEDLLSISSSFYGKGKQILDFLQLQNRRILSNYDEYNVNIKLPSYKKRLSELKKSLKIARKTYNLPRA